MTSQQLSMKSLPCKILYSFENLCLLMQEVQRCTVVLQSDEDDIQMAGGIQHEIKFYQDPCNHEFVSLHLGHR